MEKQVEVDGVYFKRLYRGRFQHSMTSRVHREIYEFLSTGEIREQLKPIVESDEIWIKPNLSNARPPETGCITHPTPINAILDYLLNFIKFDKPIRIVETITFHKGKGINEVLVKLPPKEREAIESRIKSKDPNQDMHDFGFDLLLELGGIKDIVNDYKAKGKNVDVLNLSKDPTMNANERKQIALNVEHFLGKEVIPKDEIKNRLLNWVPSVLGGEKKVGLISLAVPKTHDDPEAYMTATVKNIGLGLFLRYKAFMHKDFAKAMLYNFALWKVGLNDRIFGIVSGPYGQDCEGPIFGRAVDFPYVVAGADLLKVDSVTAVLMFGKTDLIPQLRMFKYGENKVGKMVSIGELQKILPYALNYEAYPYPSK